MNIIKIVSGILFFDEFDDQNLKLDWLLIPNDSLRYSLVEKPGYLKLYHNTPDLLLLIEETSTSYVLDVKNEYVPSDGTVQGGLIVFKATNDNLELLEYYSDTQDESIVYEFLRLEKSNSVYTGYGKNHIMDDWELIGSTEFTGSGKVGITLKGYNIASSPSMDLDFFRMYKDHTIQIVNVPLNYTVSLRNEEGTSIQALKVKNTYNGVTFILDSIPPITSTFQIFDENNVLIKTSDVFDIVGGDVFYYGAYPILSMNGINLLSEEECFLGYFTSSIINFVITVSNPYSEDLTNLVISPVQYELDDGYKMVTFSKESTGPFESSILIDCLKTEETISIYGIINRDLNLIPLSSSPFKFNLGVTFV